jgi:uncharacterized Zn-finger protein
MALFILADIAMTDKAISDMISIKRQSHKHKCGLCFYSTKHGWILKRHMLTHSGNKPYVCKICGKRFRQTAHLSGHKKTHLPIDAPCDKTKILKHIQKTEMKTCS